MTSTDNLHHIRCPYCSTWVVRVKLERKTVLVQCMGDIVQIPYSGRARGGVPEARKTSGWMVHRCRAMIELENDLRDSDKQDSYRTEFKHQVEDSGPCPRCYAAVGEPCHSLVEQGVTTKWPHTERVAITGLAVPKNSKYRMVDEHHGV